MKLTKRQLKRIIREEYSRLKKRGLIKESYEAAQNAHSVGAYLLLPSGNESTEANQITEFPFKVMTRNNELYQCEEDCIEIERPMSFGQGKSGWYYKIDLAYCEQIEGEF